MAPSKHASSFQDQTNDGRASVSPTQTAPIGGNLSSSNQLNGSSVPESIQPSSQSVPTTSNTNPNVPSNVNVICGPALSATEQQPSVSNPTVLNPPFISGPTQVDSASIPTPPTVPPTPPTPLSSFSAADATAAPNGPMNIPMISPPTSGINYTQSGSITYSVNRPLNNNAIGGISSTNSNPENSPLFIPNPVLSNSTVPQNNELPSNDVPAIKPSTSVPQSPKPQTSSAPLLRPPKPNSPALKPKSSPPPPPPPPLDHPQLSNSQNHFSSTTFFSPKPIPEVSSSSIVTPCITDLTQVENSIPTPPTVPPTVTTQDTELSISIPPTVPPTPPTVTTQDTELSISIPPTVPPTPLSSSATADATTDATADATTDATAAPNGPMNISMISPPTSGINYTQSGSITYSVNRPLNNNAIGGISSTNSNPENSPLFIPNPVLSNSTVPQNNEISLNGDNNHSQPSNVSGDSISPPPVEKGTGREMNEKNRNQAPENPAYIDRSGVSEDEAPKPPTICPSPLNENDGNVPTQHKSEDESDHQDQDSENDSDDNCKKGCTCY